MTIERVELDEVTKNETVRTSVHRMERLFDAVRIRICVNLFGKATMIVDVRDFADTDDLFARTMQRIEHGRVRRGQGEVFSVFA